MLQILSAKDSKKKKAKTKTTMHYIQKVAQKTKLSIIYNSQ